MAFLCMQHVSLTRYSNYRIGGPADFFCPVKTRDELEVVIREAHRTALPIIILGGGTNLLVSDEGVRGIVVKPEFRTLEAEGTVIRVGAGVPMEDVLEFAARKGLTGLEWAGGLPGTAGGAIRGNAGAFGGEMEDVIREVTSVPLRPGRKNLLRRSARACRFSYRSSVFKEQNGTEVIIEALLALGKGDPRRIRAAIVEKIRYRKERHPLEYPNIGSIFKNVDVRAVPKRLLPQFAHVMKTDPFPVIPTAYLISEAGLKGVSSGGAMISPKHPNFIVNVLQATAQDVKTLIALVKFRVKERFAIHLEEEIISIGA